MSKDQKSSFGSLIILLLSILSITSCLELSSSDDTKPATLEGKWELVRVEEESKTISPPTDSIPVWLELTKEQVAASGSDVASYKYNGEALVNLYNGVYTVQSDRKLKIQSLVATERSGPVPYMEFDQYYYNQLKKAVSYTIDEETLIIKTSDNHLLLYIYIFTLKRGSNPFSFAVSLP